MRTRVIRAVFHKELREICRDKKTLFTMFALPLIVYPLLIIGVATVMTLVMNHYETETYSLSVDPQIDAAITQRLTAELEDVEYRFALTACEDYAAALDAGEIDAALTVDGSTYTIVYDSSSNRSSTASDYLYEQLEAYRRQLSEEQLRALGLEPQPFLAPISVEYSDLASEEASFGSVFGSFIPLLLLLGVFMGAMTPAVNLTAGEKERGTQETMMTFPISGHELICGKYLAVALSGAVSAMLYIITIGILVAYVYGVVDALGASMVLDLSAFAPSAAMTLAAVLAFSLFLGAALMCICSFTKSTTEASSYCSPLMVVIMLVSYIAYLDIHLTTALSIVPVLNIVLLIKSVLVFEYNAPAILLVLISNLAYAALAIAVLGKLYTSERILFGESEGSLLERRTARIAGAVPTPGDSVLTLLIALLLFLYAGSLLQLKYLLIGLGLSQLIIGGVPLLSAWYGKVDFRETFSLRAVRVKQLLALPVLALGSYLFFNAVCQPIAALAEKSAETYSDTFELLRDGQSFGIALLVIGIAPAICEELLFRGYLFSSLRKKVKPAAAIVISSLLFGIYHFNLFQSSYAFLLGMVIAYTVYCTGSLLCGCFIHFVCNSLSVVLTYFEEPLTEALPFLVSDSTGVWLAVLGVGAGLTALGILLLRSTAQKKHRPDFVKNNNP